MSNNRTISTAATPDVCTFTLLSNGQEVSKTLHVVSVSVVQEINRIPAATIVVLDGEAARETFAIADTNVFTPGNEMEIKAGYRGKEDTIFKGIVIKQTIKVRKNTSYLVAECRHKAVKMTQIAKNRYFTNQKDSEIIEDIIGAYGLGKDVADTGAALPEMVQFAATDWDFILHRAAANGLFCIASENKISVKPPDFSASVAESVQYGSSLLEIDAETDSRTQYALLKTHAWNPANQEITEAEASEPNMQLNGNLSAKTLAESISPDAALLLHGGNLQSPELQNWANAMLLRSRLSKMRGRVKMQGTPKVKAGVLLQLNGLGQRFSGKAYVSGVKHQIVKGNWETDAQIGYPDEWLAAAAGAPQKQMLLPAIEGLQIGIVTQLENDPNGEDRILLRLPLISTQEEGIWARVATLDAGNKRGTFFRPEIGDEVVVGFLHNDPRHAVVLGMLNSSAKPAPLTAKDTNHQKGYVSRSEMKMLFDDEKKILSLQTPAGNKITLSEDKTAVQIEDQNGNKIVLNNSGISIESAKSITLKAAQNISLEGLSISVKAQTGFKADGGGGCELSAGNGSTVVKGSIVRIN